MRYSPDRKQHTRARVIDHGAQALREGGVSAVRIGPVMAKAGLTHGGFYAHFNSREALLAAILSQIEAESSSLATLFEPTTNPSRALNRFVQDYLSPKHLQRRRGSCPLPIMLPQAELLSDPMRAGILELRRRMERRLQELLAQMGRPSPEDGGRALLAQLLGLIAVARSETDPRVRDSVLAAGRREIARQYTPALAQ